MSGLLHLISMSTPIDIDVYEYAARVLLFGHYSFIILAALVVGTG